MPVLTFTALEAMLLGAGISLLTAVAVRLLFASRFVSRAECRIQREMLIRQKKTNDLMFAMFRAIIAHMDNLAPNERERILNLRLPDKEN